MCNFNRLNETFLGNGECFPSELDWIGFDIYGYSLNVSFAAQRDAIKWNLFGRLRGAGQRVIPTVTGHGGRDGSAATANWTLADFDKFCVATARAWIEYALGEPRLGGVFPWHWNTYMGGIATQYAIGLVDLPLCRAVWDGFGEIVRATNPGGIRHHSSSPRPDSGCGSRWVTAPSWSWCDTHH